jgi:two-component system cell cycle response regulator CtrA
MRVLLIEDDVITAKSVENVLKSEGFSCDVTDLGEEGVEIGRIYEYDLIVLDLILPDIDGYEILKRFRNSFVKTPIIILSGLSEIEDKIKGLGFGADDYLTKPFNRDELLARIRAIIRRSNGHPESIIRIGKLVLNLQSRAALVNGEPISLTTKEYKILELLALRRGSILTKEMFLNHLYGGIDEPELKIIDVFICKLRRKITKAIGEDGYIQTVWGHGYTLKDPGEDSIQNIKNKFKKEGILHAV